MSAHHREIFAAYRLRVCRWAEVWRASCQNAE